MSETLISAEEARRLTEESDLLSVSESLTVIGAIIKHESNKKKTMCIVDTCDFSDIGEVMLELKALNYTTMYDGAANSLYVSWKE